MAEKTGIQWCDATWNPWQSCHKVSEGCRNCYMYRQKERYEQDPTQVIRSAVKTFTMPLKLKEPQRVFVCSWSDFFIEEADAWRAEAWIIMRATPHLTYQIPTKRPERIKDCLPADWGEGWPNVWLGVSVEDQESADNRLAILKDVTAKLRWASVEPLLGPITPDSLAGLDWLVLGGESGDIGTKYDPRPFPIENAIDIVKMAQAAGVATFCKQLGTLWAKAHGDPDDKGGTLELFPEDLRIRQFPGGVR